MSLFDSIEFPLPLYGNNRYLLRGAGSLSIWKRVDKKLFKVKKEKNYTFLQIYIFPTRELIIL